MDHRCLLLVPLLFTASQSAPPTIEEDPLHEVIEQAMRDQAIPSLTAAIFDEHSIIWSTAHGMSDPHRKAEATEDSLYVLSSICKLFVAVAAMQQAERGMLDLDADVSDYLGFTVRHPGAPETPITTRLLLAHSAGLENPSVNEHPEYYTMQRTGDHPDTSRFLEEIFQNDDLWREVKPGERTISSNLGVSLVAQIIEKTSGIDFGEYCKREIFEPLAMNDTSYDHRQLDQDRIAAVGDGEDALRHITGPEYAAGLARSSVADISRFMQAMMRLGELDGNRILSEQSARDMLDVEHPDANMAFNAGLAKFWRAYGPDRKWLGHTGGGFITASVDFHVDHRVGVVILTNGRAKRTVMPGGTIYETLHEAAMQHAAGRP